MLVNGTRRCRLHRGLPSSPQGCQGRNRQKGRKTTRGIKPSRRARGRLKTNSNTRSNKDRPAVFRFAHNDEASRKRGAEEALGDTNRVKSTADEIKSLKSLIFQLLDRENERSREAETRNAEINDLKREVQELKKLLQPGVAGRPSYAAALGAGTYERRASATTQPHRAVPTSPTRRLRVEDDECSITVNTSRVKGEKADFVRIRAAMRKGIENNPMVQGLQIRCLREVSGDRINVIFANEEHAKKARGNTEWLTAAVTDARVKSKEWYPIKCDMEKRAVLDGRVEGGQTLRKEMCAEFAEDNRSDDVDFTAMKASWLSRIDL